MDFSWSELGLELPGASHALRTGIRLLVAVLLGAAIGLNREWKGQQAGLRTHVLVALGAALFTIVPLEDSEGDTALSEIAKGISAGIGFLGAGTILKLTDQQEVKGLTTAAGIWLTAAVGFAAGAGWIWPAVTTVALGLIALIFFRRVEIWIGSK
jgi:putative Mg2+ transporter-C (MgtC) family protein